MVMARGTKRRPQALSQGRPSHPEPQSKMQRKRTGPGVPRAGRPRAKGWGNLAFETLNHIIESTEVQRRAVSALDSSPGRET
jgi:hypothetical protein